ncbi:MAG: c-type cytochrome [Candidatus Dactylopiibacterium sp.]|nr:c-type cytochrome [Candidatus Dactylopiibacterium sp.]
MNKVSRLSPLIAFAAASVLLACGKAKVDEETTAHLIQPVARLELSAEPVATGPMSGEEIVTKICSACHGTGVSGAPRMGDKAAWAPRLAEGMNTVYNIALNGKGAMPARGGRPTLSDDEVKSAVDFLVKQVQ